MDREASESGMASLPGRVTSPNTWGSVRSLQAQQAIYQGHADDLGYFDNRYVSGALIVAGLFPQGVALRYSIAGAGATGLSASEIRAVYLGYVDAIDARIEYLEGCVSGS